MLLELVNGMGMELQGDKNTRGRYEISYIHSCRQAYRYTVREAQIQKYGQAEKRQVNNIAADDIRSFRNGNVMQTDWMKDRWENIICYNK
jgi:hypothetical protein